MDGELRSARARRSRLSYVHVDVFSSRPYSGNSLAVFPEAPPLDAHALAAITRELRHFESIFLSAADEPNSVHARVFDLGGELEFAGHPVLGAACVLHAAAGGPEGEWVFDLKAKRVEVKTLRRDGYFEATLNQGRAEWLGSLGETQRRVFAESVNLGVTDLVPELPLEVVSTGLRYLILPVRSGLERARILRDDFEPLLASVGAQFAYVLDVEGREGRHWNNDGLIEDVATGSAAGTVGAYLLRHGRVNDGEPFVLRQGRFLGRPSEIRVSARGTLADVHTVLVGGDVSLVGRGELLAAPVAQAG